MLAPYSEIEHMDARWIAAGIAGVKAWSEFSRQGHDIDFHQNGSLFIAHEQDRYILDRFISHLPAEKKHTQSTTALEPMVAERFSEGLFLEEEAHLHPRLALNALYKELEQRGVEFIQSAAEPEALQSKYNYVIDCRGSALVETEETLRNVKGELAVVHNPDFKLSRPLRLMHPRYPLYIVPRPDQHFMIGATMIESDSDEHVSVRSSLELMSALYSLHPSFSDAHIVEMQAGLRPSYIDNLPRITQRENILICNGLFRHGFLLAPVMAACVNDMLGEQDNAFTSLFIGENDEHHHQRRREEHQHRA